MIKEIVIPLVPAQEIADLIDNDQCPVCRGELDTGYECNSCGFDALEIAAKRYGFADK